jgi:outer membrane protein TolC
MSRGIRGDTATWLLAIGIAFAHAGATRGEEAPPEPLPSPSAGEETSPAAGEPPVPGRKIEPQNHLPPSLRDRQVTPINLATALDLAGVRNPELLLARERVNEADANRQFAAAQALPNLNTGANFDQHFGPLQQSSGKILSVARSSNFLGLGVNPIAAGTVNVPGVMWNQNLAQGVVTYLVSRQTVRQQQYVSEAIRNRVLGRVAAAYVDLLQTAGRRAVLTGVRDDAAEIARLTHDYAISGRGRPADADRAATELARREAELIALEGDLLVASSRLAQLLNLDPTVELRPAESWVVPTPIVPDGVALPQLLGLAYLRRPELAADRVAIETAILSLRGAKLLPFSPTTLVGFSAGTMGGGSNLVSPRFGDYHHRSDFDALAYWTLQSLGVGNRAQVDIARSRVRQSDLRRLQTLNLVREQVAAAYDRAQVRFTSIDTAERAVRVSIDAFNEDLLRIRNNEGLPIEVLDSLRLLGRARLEYLDSIAEYNRAQFELYVALGQPPARALAEPPAVNRGTRRPAPKPPSPAELAAKIDERDKVSPRYLPLAHWTASRDEAVLTAQDQEPPEEHGSRSARGTADRSSTIVPQSFQQDAPREDQRPKPVAQLSFDEPDREPQPEGLPLPPGSDFMESLPDADAQSEASRVRAETLDAPAALPASESEYVIDLPATARLILSANPTVAEARELVRETLALQTKARAMMLPSLNAGLMYHNHQGNLQASTGQMKNIYNSSLYYGGGTRAVAAEAPALPMVRIFSHLGDAIYEPLAVRQQVTVRQFDSRATAHTLLLEGIIRYFELLAAETRLEAMKQSERELAEIVRISEHFVRTGVGRASDLDRTEAEAYLMHVQAQQAEERLGLASARLAALLSLDTAVRLKTGQGPIPGLEIVDPDVGLQELLRVAERRRPELASGSAAIAQTRTRVRQEQMRPLLPLVMAGYSSASFGGGGVLFPPQLSQFRGREDFDVMALWSLQNLGVGNVATVAERRAELNQAIAERLRTLNDVRQQVVAAYGLVLGERTQIQIAQRQLSDSERAFGEELERLINADTLPIEVLNSLKQLAMSRQTLVEAVAGYNKAQFRLYVSIGFSPVQAMRGESSKAPRAPPREERASGRAG